MYQNPPTMAETPRASAQASAGIARPDTVNPGPSGPSGRATLGPIAKRLGGAAIVLFAIKGLAWLAVPAALAAWASR